MENDCWRRMISKALAEKNENWEDVVHNTLTAEQLDDKFDSGFGDHEGRPFTLWTTKRVYFPVKYDGAEWVESVPRNPCDEKSEHVGGGS